MTSFAPVVGRAPTTNDKPTRTSARSSVAAQGARDIVPLTVGYLPFAITIGAVIAAGPLNPVAGWFGAPTIAAGAAHLTLVELLASGGGVTAAVAAALIINLRLLAYGAGLVPWFADESRRSRMVLAWFIIDPTYFVAVDRFERDDPGPSLRRWYFLGAGAALYPLWSLGVAVGLVAGAAIPAALELEMAATLMMVGMLASAIGPAGQRLSVAIGLIVGVFGFGLPGQAKMLVAAAIAFGLALREQETDR